jgi:hypothetical protein
MSARTTLLRNSTPSRAHDLCFAALIILLPGFIILLPVFFADFALHDLPPPNLTSVHVPPRRARGGAHPAGHACRATACWRRRDSRVFHANWHVQTATPTLIDPAKSHPDNAYFAPTGASTIIEQGGFPIKHNADGSVAITAKPREARVFNGRKYADIPFLLADTVTSLSLFSFFCRPDSSLHYFTDVLTVSSGSSWKRPSAATLPLSKRGKATRPVSWSGNARHGIQSPATALAKLARVWAC